MKLKSLYTLATVILLTAATALAAGSTRTGSAKAARSGAPQRIAAAAADIPTQWEDMGEGEFTEDIMTYFEDYEPQTYNVNVEKATTQPGWYRIVNPFEKNPVVEDDEWNEYELSDGDYYIYIDASDPEHVIIPKCELGIVDYGGTYVYSLASEVEGKLINNVITFEAYALVLIGKYGQEETNANGAFRLVLPEVKEEPVIPDDPDDKLTVTIKINDPDFISFIKLIELDGDKIEPVFVNDEFTFKAESDSELIIEEDLENYTLNSVNVEGAPYNNSNGTFMTIVDDDLKITFNVERKPVNNTATLNIDTPENVIISQNGNILTLNAGENTITFSNKDENSGKLTITAQPGCNILSVEQNGSDVKAESGKYEITLNADDEIIIKTEKIVVKDPVVTIKINDPEFIEYISIANNPDDITAEDFENGEITLEKVKGKALRFQCYTDDYKVISFTVNGERKIFNADGTFEITVDGDMTIEFNVVAYQTFTATIKIDDPANAVVKQNGTTLTLKAGENTVEFTDKDINTAKLTIAKAGVDLNVTLNGKDVYYDPGNEYFPVTLTNGAVVDISKDAPPTAIVILKIDDPAYINAIDIDGFNEDVEFTEGVAKLEVDVDAEITIEGDKDKYLLKGITVDGEKVENAGYIFEFTVEDDMVVEFDVEAYHDVNATINVDAPEGVTVTPGPSKPLVLEAGDNTFSFSNKNADNGKVTIAPLVGFKIVAVTLNEEPVEAQTGDTYTVVLAEGDVLKIETAVITYDVTLKISDDSYVKSIKNGDEAVEPAFEEGVMTLEVVYGSAIAIEGDNENFKFKSLTVDSKPSDDEGPEFSFKVTADMLIEFDVEAYRDVTATINVDAPENVLVIPAGAEDALELKAGENKFTFNNKDAENGKITIAAQEGCRIVSVTHNDKNVAAEEDETFTVTLAEGDVLTVESTVNKAANHNVTIKVNADGYFKSIKIGDETIETAFEEGVMIAEVADGSAIIINGDNENFKLISLTVDDVKSEAKGPEFKFTVTADMTIEFDVEAYRDVTATIEVDTPENIKVTLAAADDALELNAGENTFTFSNKDADNGKITIVPQAGSRIVAVTLNDETVAAEAGAYTLVLVENDKVKITSEKIPVEDPVIRVTVKLDNPGAIIYSYTNADNEAQDAIVNAKENVIEAEVVKYPTFYAANGYVITSCVDEAGKEYDIMYDGGAVFVSYSQIKSSKTYTITTESDAKTRDAAVTLNLYAAGKVEVRRGYYDVYGLKDGDNTLRFKSGSKENEITISSRNPDEKIGDVLLNGESQRASGTAYTLTVKDGDIIKVLDKAAPVVPVQEPVVTIKINEPDYIQLIDVDTEDVDPDFTDGVMTFEATKGSILTIHGDADNFKLRSVTVNGEKNSEVTSSSFRYTITADLTLEFDVDRYRTLIATIDVDDPTNIKVTKGGSFSSSDVTLKAGEQSFEFTNKDENSGKLTITTQPECRILSITQNGENVPAAEFGVYKVALAENDVLKITSKKIIRDKDVIVYRDDVSMINDFTFRYSDNTHRFITDNGYTTVKFCDEDLPIHCSFQSETIAQGTAEVYIDDELVDREEAEADIFSLNPDHNSVIKVFHNGPATFHDLTFAVEENAGEITAKRDLVKPIEDLTKVQSLHAGTKVELSVENPEAVKEVLINDKPLEPVADNQYSFILNAPTSVKVIAKQSTSGILSTIGAEEGNEEIYNLQGIRIFRAINELPEGIYIINGKKVMISQ